MKKCSVCDAVNIHFLAEKENYSFNQCNQCKFIFMDPMPTQDELNAQYTEYDPDKPPSYDKVSSRLRRAYIKLPRLFPHIFNKEVLDLGCGGGFVAHVMNKVARSSTGIDISPNAIAYAKSTFKKPLYKIASFADLLQTNEKYDFIYSSEVIEHISDINLYMQVLTRLIKKKGLVYITTPDSGHKKVPDKINEWDVFSPPVHVQFFCKQTVEILFKRYGFVINKYYRNNKPGLIFLAQKN